MRTLYFDCFAGISGDMVVGALLDAGADLETIKAGIDSLCLSGYSISSSRVTRRSLAAVKFNVELDSHPQPERGLVDITDMIIESRLSEAVKARSIRIFEKLAHAEAVVHGTTTEKVHFHEVGAVDSIIDIVGAMIALEELGVDRFASSSLRTGFGSIEAAHGRLPIPAPGTAELLRRIPIYAGDIEGEFVTPTGAAIVATICESFGPLLPMAVGRIGYGAGSRDPDGLPNVLRVIIGEPVPSIIDQLLNREGSLDVSVGNVAGLTLFSEQPMGVGSEPVTLPSMREPNSSRAVTLAIVIECNIDDMNPQAYGYVMEKAFSLGALDVFISPIQMKKDRPGSLLSIICETERVHALIELLLTQTTTLGVRYYSVIRRVLERVIETVETEFGPVRVKVALDGGRTLHFQPEFEDCARLAERAGVPLLEVQSAASSAYRQQMKPPGN